MINSRPKVQPVAVFLDRDGVLNRAIIKNNKPYPPANLGELEIPGDVASSIFALKAAGFLTIVVTNQPDVARGTTKRETVDLINHKLVDKLLLDDVFVCFHDDTDKCFCRKPQPGLLLMAAKQYGINLTNSYMIGDRWKDIEAGQSAGCRTIWIDHGYAEKVPLPDYKTTSLSDAVSWILKNI